MEGTDLSPEMVAQLQANIESFGFSHAVHCSVQDVQALPEEWTGTFDVVFGLSMIMFAPDKAAALASIRRVLKPGGRAVISSWAALADNPASSILYQAQEDALQMGFERLDTSDPAVKAKLEAHVPVPQRRHPNYCFGDQVVFRDALLAAGFASVRWAHCGGGCQLFELIPTCVCFVSPL